MGLPKVPLKGVAVVPLSIKYWAATILLPPWPTSLTVAAMAGAWLVGLGLAVTLVTAGDSVSTVNVVVGLKVVPPAELAWLAWAV